MESLIKRHDFLKKKLDELKTKKARLEGLYQAAMKEAKEKYECDSIDELSEKIDFSEKELDRLKALIPPILDEIERMIGDS